MPTLWSQTLIPTARQVPGEAEVPSHQLMLRAGFIRKLGAGVYDYLPLGLRSLKKVMAIVRQEMDRAGAIEVFLPTLQPVELWEQTGRRAAYGENLFVVQDRHGRQQALGPTHEEVITELVGAYIESYKQLPITLYQIQTKFRDEFRPRFGVLRSREFQMKDAYSFHLSLEGRGGLDETYQKQYDAYCRIFKRCGLPYEPVEAESGPIGGSASHEFMVPSPTGEDVILKSDKGNYAANVEKCENAEQQPNLVGPATGDLKTVKTPGASKISDLCSGWKKFSGGKLKPENVLKTLLYRVEGDLTDEEETTAQELKNQYGYEDDGFVFNWLIVLRGDHEVNEAKLNAELLDIHKREMRLSGKNTGLTLMEEHLAAQLGFVVGFVGPDAFNHLEAGEKARTYVIIDYSAAQTGFWVAGANKLDHHVMHFNWERDFAYNKNKHRVHVADIRNAVDGDPSPQNDGGVLRETKGIEIGHVFKLGCKYTQKLDVTVLDEKNERIHPIMGCYGIGVNRILAAAIERQSGHDDNGIIWPASIAPYEVIVTPIKYAPGSDIKNAAEKIAHELESLGHDVLIDDRDERPGVKFKDADLIGIPIRITIGDKALANGQVEIKRRTADKPELSPVDQAAQRVEDLLAASLTERV